MNQFQVDQRAITAGLMLPQEHPTDEPRLTEAGLFAMLGAFAYNADVDEDVRMHNLAVLVSVLDVARDGGLVEWAETFLLCLFSEGVSPVDSSDKGQLLSVLCRLVSLSVGSGRMASVIQGAKAN